MLSNFSDLAFNQRVWAANRFAAWLQQFPAEQSVGTYQEVGSASFLVKYVTHCLAEDGLLLKGLDEKGYVVSATGVEGWFTPTFVFSSYWVLRNANGFDWRISLPSWMSEFLQGFERGQAITAQAGLDRLNSTLAFVARHST